MPPAAARSALSEDATDHRLAGLCARLLRGIHEDSDEAAALATENAQAGVLAALARARPGTAAGVALKVDAVIALAEAGEGFIGTGELLVLRSASRDLHRLHVTGTSAAA